MELFSSSGKNQFEPLAHRMRPRTLEEYVGQEHIIGEGRLLQRAIRADQLSSIIFYGPPGTGKTTLARVIANTTKSNFITINAVLSGVKEIRETIAKAQELRNLYDQKTILFVDEVHRWNKSQQDALLPWVENGTFILIGATIENPYFEVNRALLSRSRIFQLVPLSDRDLSRIAEQAIKDPDRGYGKYRVTIDDDALAHLVRVANGDARSLLNALELAVETTPKVFPPEVNTEIRITLEIAEQSIQKKVVLYDKEGDYHFDTISAFIKSLRGSDPDAALYWLSKMIFAGEEPRFIFRRMLIFSCEDVGMADPNAIVVTQNLAAAFERVGLPEGRFHLAHAAIYLSTCPKSNSVFGFFDALDTVEKESGADVPNHLKDSNRDSNSFGHGEGYLYPHAYRDHWIAQQYLPASLKGRIFYRPSDRGYEAGIREEVTKRREEQLNLMFDDEVPQVLTFSPPDRKRDLWLKRSSSTQSAMLAEIKKEIFAPLKIRRHDRILVVNETGGLLLWEAFRRVPEGFVCALVGNQEQYLVQQQYAQILPETEKPVLIQGNISGYAPGSTEGVQTGVSRFDVIIGRNTLTRISDKQGICDKYFTLLCESGSISLSELVPSKALRLSSLLSPHALSSPLLEKLKQAEEAVYHSPANPLVNWSEDDIAGYFEKAGFCDITLTPRTYREERMIREEDLNQWLKIEDRDTNGKENYGTGIKAGLADAEFRSAVEAFRKELPGTTQKWTSTIAFISARKKEHAR